MKLSKLISIASALILTLASASAFANLAQTATVYFKGEAGSWVSGAIGAPQVTWKHGVDGLFSAHQNFDKGVSISYNDGNYWNFDFAAPTYNPQDNTNDGQLLHVGLYSNATRFPFNSPTRPGLNISGNGRGNNTLGGWFNVREIVYGPGNDITKFAVDFRQFDESPNQTGPSLYGSLRFNSSIAITPVPEPETYAMLGIGLLALAVVRKRRKTA